MSIGENIKKWRELRNLKQSELAELLGVSDKTVSSWEINRTEPKMGMVEKISAALNCKKTDIIGLDDDNIANDFQLSARDERDISRRLEKTLDDLENQQDALMFDGAPMDDQTRELLKASLENSIRIAKINAKKFTPKKYLHTNEKQGE